MKIRVLFLLTFGFLFFAIGRSAEKPRPGPEPNACKTSVSDADTVQDPVTQIRIIWKQLSNANAQKLEELVGDLTMSMSELLKTGSVTFAIDENRRFALVTDSASIPLSNARGIVSILEKTPRGEFVFQQGSTYGTIRGALDTFFFEGKIPETRAASSDAESPSNQLFGIPLNARLKTARSPDEILDLINEHSYRVNEVNLTTAIFLIAQFAKATHLEDAEALTASIREQIANRLENDSTRHLFGPRNLSSIALALANIGIQDDRLLGLITSQSLAEINRFNKDDVSMLAHAYATLFQKPKAMVLIALAGRATAIVNQFSDELLSRLLRDLAILSYYPENLLSVSRARFDSPPSDPKVGDRLAMVNIGLVFESDSQIRFPVPERSIEAPTALSYNYEAFCMTANRLGFSCSVETLYPFTLLLANRQRKVSFEIPNRKHYCTNGFLRGYVRFRARLLEHMGWNVIFIHNQQARLNNPSLRLDYVGELLDTHVPGWRED